MKVLLSAYSCRPGCGSELGVGWRWASELALGGSDVWLLTRTIFHPYIEQELRERPITRLRVVYYDPPSWVMGLGIYVHYYIWQIGVLSTARALCRTVKFDVIQHITLGVFRQPSFLANLSVPFIFGPVGGGESAPAELRRDFPFRGRMIDYLRDGVNWLANQDPFLRALYARSILILCKTEDTRIIIPSKYRHKAVVKREIGIDLEPEEMLHYVQSGRKKAELQVLYVGRLIYWKGLHLGLQAFAQLLKQHPDAQLTVIGTGKEDRWLKQRTQELDIVASVRWLGKIEHSDLLRKYADFDVFLFPSLHDSSGNVVLEALSAGLPVICLDLGGPPTMVDDSCGCVVPARHSSREQVVSGLHKALVRFAEDPSYLAHCSAGARYKVETMSWRNTVADAYVLIESKIAGRIPGS